jgi:hypothetical protein
MSAAAPHVTPVTRDEMRAMMAQTLDDIYEAIGYAQADLEYRVADLLVDQIQKPRLPLTGASRRVSHAPKPRQRGRCSYRA